MAHMLFLQKFREHIIFIQYLDFGTLQARLTPVSPLKIKVAALNNSYKKAQLSSDESVSDGHRVNRASWQ